MWNMFKKGKLQPRLSVCKGIKGRGRLTNAEMDHDSATWINVGNLKWIKKAVWTSCFHSMSMGEHLILSFWIHDGDLKNNCFFVLENVQVSWD